MSAPAKTKQPQTKESKAVVPSITFTRIDIPLPSDVPQDDLARLLHGSYICNTLHLRLAQPLEHKLLGEDMVAFLKTGHADFFRSKLPLATQFFLEHRHDAVVDTEIRLGRDAILYADRRLANQDVTEEDVKRLATLNSSEDQRRVRLGLGRRFRRGSLKLYKDVPDEQRKDFAQAYGPDLAFIKKLYDPEELTDVIRFLRETKVNEVLLAAFREPLTAKGKPNPLRKPYGLAHYLAAPKAGIEIARKRHGKLKLVGLKTLETERQRGDVLLGINRKKKLKRRPKADTARANR